MQTNQSRILKWSLIAGLVIVINLFFGYSLSLIYKQPDFNAYCPASQVNQVVNTQTACVADGGQWTQGDPTYAKVPGYCNLQFTCQNNYETANKDYSRNVFVTLVILGALLVLIGNFMKGNAVISSGLSLAGVLSFVIASIRYWSYASDFLHVGILAVALIMLLWIATKKFRNHS